MVYSLHPVWNVKSYCPRNVSLSSLIMKTAWSGQLRCRCLPNTKWLLPCFSLVLSNNKHMINIDCLSAILREHFCMTFLLIERKGKYKLCTSYTKNSTFNTENPSSRLETFLLFRLQYNNTSVGIARNRWMECNCASFVFMGRLIHFMNFMRT